MIILYTGFISSMPLLESDLIEDLQIEGVDPGRDRALDDFDPARVFCSIVGSRRLIDGIAQSNPAVRVHACHPIVLRKLRL